MFRPLSSHTFFRTLTPPFARLPKLPNYHKSFATSTSRCQDLEQQIPFAEHQAALESLNAEWRSRLQSEKSDLESVLEQDRQFGLRRHENLKSWYNKRKTHYATLEHQYNELESLNSELRDKYNNLLNSTSNQARDVSDARAEALQTYTKLMRMEQDFNISGAMKRIVYHARLETIISCHDGILSRNGILSYDGTLWPDGIQLGLDELAKSKYFKTALKEVAKARNLVCSKVTACVHNLYDQVSELSSGNDDPYILIPADKFTPNQVAALVTFLEMQKSWKDSLEWREV